MAVKIGDKIFRGEQEQVQKNMEDIQMLKQYIKEAYKCSSELTSSTDQVLKSSTNAGEDVISGWLIDPIGNLFTITGGDDTYLLLDFFTSLRGPQGEQGESGAEVQIDDNSTSATKVWSSQKVSNLISVNSDKGIYYTTVQPTESDGEYTLLVSDLGNRNTYIQQYYNNLILYVDGDSLVAEMYKVISVSGDKTILYLSKVGDVGGGGSQLYQHNVLLYNYNNTQSYMFRIRLTIINDSSEVFTYDTLQTYFNNHSTNIIHASGMLYGKNTASPHVLYIVYGVKWVNDTSIEAQTIQLASNGSVSVDTLPNVEIILGTGNVAWKMSDNIITI